MDTGSLVRVLPPFDGAYPDTYQVVSVSNGTATLENGVDFDGTYLTVVGQVVAPPAPRQPITKLAFLRRMTATQRIAMRQAAETDRVLQDALALLDAAQDIRTDDPDTVAMVAYCVSLGLLTSADQQTILA